MQTITSPTPVLDLGENLTHNYYLAGQHNMSNLGKYVYTCVHNYVKLAIDMYTYAIAYKYNYVIHPIHTRTHTHTHAHTHTAPLLVDTPRLR